MTLRRTDVNVLSSIVFEITLSKQPVKMVHLTIGVAQSILEVFHLVECISMMSELQSDIFEVAGQLLPLDFQAIVLFEKQVIFCKRLAVFLLQLQQVFA